jgi:hypothetical protein
VNQVGYRRLIDAYRGKLLEVDPAACDAVDDKVWGWGDQYRWVVDNNPIDPDSFMTARQIAERFGLEVHNIRAWARRHPDKIRTHRQGGRVLYLLREVLAYHVR